MPRTSLVHYITPSAISLIPNANSSANDIAVYVAKGTKIKVYSPKAGIDMDNANYQEWTLAGRNRRLADNNKSYTIYARLKKNDKSNGYVVFAPKVTNGATETDKYPSVTKDGVSSVDYTPTTDVETNIRDFWYVRLGDVSEPVNGMRTITLDTGALGTDMYNEEWELNPDKLPLRVELGCTIGDEDAGQTPYVYWGQSLVLTANLMEGWNDTDVSRFSYWGITRNTGNPTADEEWNHQYDENTYRSLEEGSITLNHTRGYDDDFNGAVAAIFTITAWGMKDGTNTTTIVQLASASMTILAETAEKYELETSSSIISYDPRSGKYTPSGGILLKIRATDQRGVTSKMTKEQIDNAGLVAEYAPTDSESWTILSFPEETTTEAVATISPNAFAEQKSLNVRLARLVYSPNETTEKVELTRTTIAFLRDGEDSKEREWIYRLNSNAGYSDTTENRGKSFQNDNFVPIGWTDDPVGVSASGDVEYTSWRDYENGAWGTFHTPIVWSYRGADAVRRWIEFDPVGLHVDSNGRCNSDDMEIRIYFWAQTGGGAPEGQGVSEEETLLTLDMTTAAGQIVNFTGTLAQFIQEHSGESDALNGFIENFTIYPVRGDIIRSLTIEWGAFAMAKLQTIVDGSDGHSPVVTIGPNGNWFVDGVDTGTKAQGEPGTTPSITIVNGRWIINGQDAGPATGEQGDDGVDAWVLLTEPSALTVIDGLKYNRDIENYSGDDPNGYATDSEGNLIPLFSGAMANLRLIHGVTEVPFGDTNVNPDFSLYEYQGESAISYKNKFGQTETYTDILDVKVISNSLIISKGISFDRYLDVITATIALNCHFTDGDEKRDIQSYVTVYINRLGAYTSSTIGDVTKEIRTRTDALDGKIENYKSEWETSASGIKGRLTAVETKNGQQDTAIGEVKATAQQLSSDYQTLSNGLQTANSRIEQNATAISPEVSRLDGSISSLEQTADSLTARVEGNSWQRMWSNETPGVVAYADDASAVDIDGHTTAASEFDLQQDPDTGAWTHFDVLSNLERGVNYRLTLIGSFAESEGLERIALCVHHEPLDGSYADEQVFYIDNASQQLFVSFTPAYTGAYRFTPYYIPSDTSSDTLSATLQWLKLERPAIPSVATLQLEADRISMGLEGLAGANLLQQSDFRGKKLADLTAWTTEIAADDEERARRFFVVENAYERFAAIHIEHPATTDYSTAAFRQNMGTRLAGSTVYTLSFHLRAATVSTLNLGTIIDRTKAIVINGQQVAPGGSADGSRYYYNAGNGNITLPATAWLWETVVISFTTRASITGQSVVGWDAYSTQAVLRQLEISLPKLEKGSVATPWTDLPDVLQRTGIDIEQGKIVATADNFEVRNNAGQKTFGVDAEGNLTATGGAKFAGTIEAKILYTTWQKLDLSDLGNVNLYDALGNTLPQKITLSLDQNKTSYYSRSSTNSRYINLPDPCDFEGLEVEIFFPGNRAYNTDGTTWFSPELRIRSVGPTLTEGYDQKRLHFNAGDEANGVFEDVAPLPIIETNWNMEVSYVYTSHQHYSEPNVLNQEYTSSKVRLLSVKEVEAGGHYYDNVYYDSIAYWRWVVIDATDCSFSPATSP